VVTVGSFKDIPDAEAQGSGLENLDAQAPVNGSAHPNADVLWSGRANLMEGSIALGGRLALTRTALVFRTHRLNPKTGTHTTPVAAVLDVTFGGINRISVVLPDNEVVTYVVFRRKLLAQQIRLAAGLGR
jgi:hypothetical protein